MDKQKAQKAAMAALRELGTSYVQIDDKICDRVEKRLKDDAWGAELPGYVGGAEPDYYFEAAVRESAQTVATAFDEGAAGPETLLEEGGLLDFVPSPEAMATYHAFSQERAIYLIDDYLAELLGSAETVEAFDEESYSLLPRCAYVATSLRLAAHDTGELFEASGFFSTVVDEIEPDGCAWRKRVIVAAVEHARRPRIVVASLPREDGEFASSDARLEDALLRAAKPYLAYFAKPSADIVPDGDARRASARPTFYNVGSNERASNRRQLLLLQNQSKAA